MDKSLSKELIEIALKDIEASILLHKSKLYSQSYFSFQQASEKANKAFGIASNIISEKQLKKDIQHNQLRMYRRSLVEEEKEIQLLLTNLQNHPEIANHKLLKIDNIKQHLANLKSGIKFHDSAKNKGALPNDSYSLSSYLKLLNDLLSVKARPSKVLFDTVSNELKVYQDFINKFGSEKAKEEIELALKTENLAELIDITIKSCNFMFKFFHMNFTFFICAILTVQHSTTTRYPEESVSPLDTYNWRYTPIRYQIKFLNHLKKGLKFLRTIVN